MSTRQIVVHNLGHIVQPRVVQNLLLVHVAAHFKRNRAFTTSPLTRTDSPNTVREFLQLFANRQRRLDKVLQVCSAARFERSLLQQKLVGPRTARATANLHLIDDRGQNLRLTLPVLGRFRETLYAGSRTAQVRHRVEIALERGVLVGEQLVLMGFGDFFESKARIGGILGSWTRWNRSASARETQINVWVVGRSFAVALVDDGI